MLTASLHCRLRHSFAALSVCILGCTPTAATSDAETPDTLATDSGTDVVSFDASGADVIDAPIPRTDVVVADIVDTFVDTDTDATDVASVDLACLGASLPIVVSGGLPYVTVHVGSGSSAPAGSFLVDLATTASAIDLGSFGSSAPPATGCNPGLTGQRCNFADLDFFGPWGSVSLITEDLSGLGGSVVEAGILGTDFTSAFALTLDYRARIARHATRAALCSDTTLAAAGFAPLSTTGFYANDVSLLRPLHDVESSASSGISVPNVPTVGVRVAGVNAVAQLDTGFNDALAAFSVNINTALFDAIQAAHPSALVRDASRDLSLTTCVVGLSESVEAYELAPGSSVDFVRTDLSVARAFSTAVIFVKRTPSGAARCGGIGTWSAPAAQIAASFYSAIGALVFDPFTSRVWITTH